MEIEFENRAGQTLCFNHAVKAVIEDDEKITASAPDINTHDLGGTGYLGGICVKCFPPTRWDDEDEEGLDEI